MIRKTFGIAVLPVVAILLISLLSCARNRQLTGITIAPQSGTFGAADSTIFFQLKAFGTYIHPPKTIDITNQVNWQSDNPQVIQVTSAGMVSPNLNCGVAQVFAEMHDNGNDIVSNSATMTVDGPASLGCTPAGPQPILTVNFSGTGTGTVVSSPAGLNCSSPSSCNATFTTGQTVTLTGTPTGTSTSVTWNGCSSASGTACTVVLENNVSVTATFQ